MIAGIRLVPEHPRTVAYYSEVEPGVFMVEPMHFLKPHEARRQARASKPRRPI